MARLEPEPWDYRSAKGRLGVNLFDPIIAALSKRKVCGRREFRQEEFEEAFHAGERYSSPDDIPAAGCLQCGESTFDTVTAESIWERRHENRRAARKIDLEVFAY